MGARAALQHATRTPDAWEALILIGSNPGIEAAADRTERRRADEQLAARIEREGIPQFLRFWEETPLIRGQRSMPSDWRKRMQAVRLSHTAKGLAQSLRQFGQGSCPNLWPQLTQLTDADPPDRRTERRQIPRHCRAHASSPRMPARHHSRRDTRPHFEQPHETAAAISEFLTSLAP